MEGTRNIAPVKLEMLMAVVHNSKLAYYCSVIQSHQANMQFTVAAKGTTHLILNYLGLSADRPKSLILSVVRTAQGDLPERRRLQRHRLHRTAHQHDRRPGLRFPGE